jgi:hypothetical protein
MMAVSNGLASLGDGFLNGFQVADQSIARRQDAAQREEALQQEKQNADRNYSLSSAQFDYTKQNTDRDYQRQLDRDRATDALNQKKLGMEKQTLGLQSAELGIRAAEAKAQIANQNWQRAYAERQDRIQNEMPLVQAFYTGYRNGSPDWNLVKKMSPDNPFNPNRFIGPDKIQTAGQVQQLMPKVLDGSIDYNDPSVINVANKVLQPHIERELGTKDPVTGQTITGKQLAHIGLTPDGQNVVLGLKVTYGDGSSALKPRTEYGSTSPQDKNITIPMKNFVAEFGGYAQAVARFNQNGDSLSAVAKNVDPTQNATIQAYRKDMLNIGTARAKALSKAADPQSTDAVNDQYDKLQDQLNQSYGIPSSNYWQNDPQLNVFTGAVQRATGKMPDLTNPATKQAFLQWKQTTANQSPASAQPAAGQPAGTQSQPEPQGQQAATQPNPDSYVAQQLREMRRVVQSRQ